MTGGRVDMGCPVTTGNTLDTVLLLSACRAPMTAAAFYVIQLRGSFGYFYCMYLATVFLGVGKWQRAHSGIACRLLSRASIQQLKNFQLSGLKRVL
jgi:hypothetical protein